jgi:LigXa C-terminal domain like
MGPPDKQPASLPRLEWLEAPDGYQHVTKWLQRTNWAQGMEGEIDTAHISFLHSPDAGCSQCGSAHRGQPVRRTEWNCPETVTFVT